MFLNGGDALSGLGDAEGEHGMHKGTYLSPWLRLAPEASVFGSHWYYLSF